MRTSETGLGACLESIETQDVINTERRLVCVTCGRTVHALLGTHCDAGHGLLVGWEVADADRFRGMYRPLCRLAAGGSSDIYLVDAPPNTEFSVVKCLHRDLLKRKDMVARLQREGRILESLREVEGVPRLLEPGARDECLVMSHVRGQSLDAVIREHHRLPLGVACNIASLALKILGQVHVRGVIVRDVKPSNIMVWVTPAGAIHVHLVDFGVSRALWETEKASITGRHFTVGTAFYMGPEQWGSAEVDERADIYSMGVVLYTMLAGVPPFVGSSDQIRHGHHYTPLEMPEEVIVPANVEYIVRRAMAKDPARRFESAEQMRLKLQDAMGWSEPPKTTVVLGEASVRAAAEMEPGATAVSAGVGSEANVISTDGHAAYGNRSSRQVRNIVGATGSVLPDALSRRFRFQKPLGEGGMGRVLLAQEVGTHRIVAVKHLPDELTDQLPFVHQFVREAVITARLEHPHIIPIYEVGRFDLGEHYYSMRFVDGLSLRHLLGHPIRPQTIRAMRDAARAVEFAHSQGLWHRDIKPSNILVGGHGEAYVIDWGLVSVQPDAAYNLNLPEAFTDSAFEDELISSTHSALTAHPVRAGTPEYMAPEAILGQSVSASCDIWSFGVILFHALTGRHPFKDSDGAADRDELIHRVLNDDVPDPRDFIPTAPPALCELVRPMLARDYRERPGTLAEFVEQCNVALAQYHGQTAESGLHQALQRAQWRLQELRRNYRARHRLLVDQVEQIRGQYDLLLELERLSPFSLRRRREIESELMRLPPLLLGDDVNE